MSYLGSHYKGKMFRGNSIPFSHNDSSFDSGLSKNFIVGTTKDPVRAKTGPKKAILFWSEFFRFLWLTFCLGFCFFWNRLKKAWFKRFEIKSSNTPVGFVRCGIADYFLNQAFKLFFTWGIRPPSSKIPIKNSGRGGKGNF